MTFAESVTAQNDAIKKHDTATGNRFAIAYIRAAETLISIGKDGVDEFATLLEDGRADVRTMAASYLLPYRMNAALRILEESGRGTGITALGAMMTIRRWKEIKAPNHIKGFIKNILSKVVDRAGSYSFYYQVICKCAGTRFRLLKSLKHALKAVCENCGNEITVYDVSCYSTASKGLNNSDAISVVHPKGQQFYKIYAIYEYSILNTGDTFDPDDITWCQVFIEDDQGNRVRIFDGGTT